MAARKAQGGQEQALLREQLGCTNLLRWFRCWRALGKNTRSYLRNREVYVDSERKTINVFLVMMGRVSKRHESSVSKSSRLRCGAVRLSDFLPQKAVTEALARRNFLPRLLCCSVLSCTGWRRVSAQAKESQTNHAVSQEIIIMRIST